MGEEHCGNEKMEEAIVDGSLGMKERVMFDYGIRFERDEGESERVSGRDSKNFRVSFWEFNLKEERRETESSWRGLKISQG